MVNFSDRSSAKSRDVTAYDHHVLHYYLSLWLADLYGVPVNALRA